MFVKLDVKCLRPVVVRRHFPNHSMEPPLSANVRGCVSTCHAITEQVEVSILLAKALQPVKQEVLATA